jgi:hypothetical protein
MGWVGRKLCFEHRQILLRHGQEYWIANLKKRGDQLLFEKRDRKRTKSVETANNRLRVELEIAADQGFPLETIYALRKQLAKISRWASGRV